MLYTYLNLGFSSSNGSQVCCHLQDHTPVSFLPRRRKKLGRVSGVSMRSLAMADCRRSMGSVVCHRLDLGHCARKVGADLIRFRLEVLVPKKLTLYSWRIFTSIPWSLHRDLTWFGFSIGQVILIWFSYLSLRLEVLELIWAGGAGFGFALFLFPSSRANRTLDWKPQRPTTWHSLSQDIYCKFDWNLDIDRRNENIIPRMIIS